MLRGPLVSERIRMVDPATGIPVMQITGHPSPSVHLMYDWPSVTPDNQRLVFTAQRGASRFAPWDVFRCGVDGTDLCQLTEYDPAAGMPTVTLTLDGRTLYVMWRDEHILRAVDVETGRTEDMISLAGFYREGALLQAVRIAGPGGRLAVSYVDYWRGGGYALIVDPVTGDVQEMPDTSVYGCDWSSGRLVVIRNFMQIGAVAGADGGRVTTNVNPEPATMWSVDEDGGDPQFIAEQDLFAHSTMLGRLGKIQGTGHRPHRCIWIAEAGREPVKAAAGVYFWHSGASFDGEWIIADTNWPDAGLKLVHVPTGRYRTLCHAGATQAHSQSGHCHPALSQDGRVAVFASDRTGVSQVYTVCIPDAFRESVKAGELDTISNRWIQEPR